MTRSFLLLSIFLAGCVRGPVELKPVPRQDSPVRKERRRRPRPAMEDVDQFTKEVYIPDMKFIYQVKIILTDGREYICEVKAANVGIAGTKAKRQMRQDLGPPPKTQMREMETRRKDV